MSYERQPDFGTPASRSAERVTLTIDGLDVTVAQGTSVLRAARENGGDIPSLCATDSVKAFGSCRMSLVDIDGPTDTPATCTPPVEPGMVVHTQTEQPPTLRRRVMGPYHVDHPPH